MITPEQALAWMLAQHRQSLLQQTDKPSCGQQLQQQKQIAINGATSQLLAVTQQQRQQYNQDDVSAKTGAPLKLMTPQPITINQHLTPCSKMDSKMVLHKAVGESSSSPYQQQQQLSDGQQSPMTDSDGGGSSPSKKSSNTKLYKTELCRSWQDKGHCNYGERCQYAHGEEELRPIPRHPKYKTERCRTFHETGYCPYGPRCHFIHDSSPVDKQQRSRTTPVALPQLPPSHLAALNMATASIRQQQGGTSMAQRVLPFSVLPSQPPHFAPTYAAATAPTTTMAPQMLVGLNSAGESPVPSSTEGDSSPGSYSPGLPDTMMTGAAMGGPLASYCEDVFQAALPSPAKVSYPALPTATTQRRFSADPILDMLLLDVECQEKFAHRQPQRLPVFARLSAK